MESKRVAGIPKIGNNDGILFVEYKIAVSILPKHGIKYVKYNYTSSHTNPISFCENTPLLDW